MKPKRVIKELEKQIRKDPQNLVLRLKLAAAYREVGRTDDAVALYRSVAVAYHSHGRLVQAIAVCKSVLEIEPSQRETQALLSELDQMRSLQAAQEAIAVGEQAVAPGPAPDYEEPVPVPSLTGGDSGPPQMVPSLANEFAQRSGMTPANIDPDIRMPEEMTPGQPQRLTPPAEKMRQLRDQARRPPQRVTRRSLPGMAQPGVRRSSSISAYTPLPEPLALHDAVGEGDSVIEMRSPVPSALTQTAKGRAPAGRLPVSKPPPAPPAPPVPPPRGQPAQVPAVPLARIQPTHRPGAPMRGRAPAPPSSAQAPPARPAPARPAPRRPPPQPPVLPPPDDDDEDEALTRIVDEHSSPADTRQDLARQDDDAPTTIAPELGFANELDSGRRLETDDAPTTIADESGLLAGMPIQPSQAQPSRPLPADPSAPAVKLGQAVRSAKPTFFERDTRRLANDEAARLAADIDPDFDDLPTPPPLGRPPGHTPAPLPVELPTPPPVAALTSAPTPDPPPVLADDPITLSGVEDLPTPIDMLTPAGAISIPMSPEDMPTPPPPGAPVARNEVTQAPVSKGDGASRPTENIPFPPELSPYQRGDRLLDVTDVEFDEATHTIGDDDDDSEPTSPGLTPEQVITNVSRVPVRPHPGQEDLELAQAFDRPFSDTISRLGPDGAVIDMPLSIFSALPEDALAEMARRMTLRNFSNGDVVLREGEPGDACFVLAHGEVRVLKRDPLNPRGDLIEVARLGSGALFGEFALLADRRRHATVQAVGNCDIYEIPRRLLRELAATFPAVGPLLEKFYRERLLATLMSTAPFLKPLPEERRGELLARFEPVRVESGERIVSEGEPAGGLYLIVLGSVEITKRVSEKRSVLLSTLGEGAYFGEMSLLKGGVACASATAVGPTELAVMVPKDFYQVVSENPRLWDEVRREANRRQLENNQIVTGETNVV